MKRLLSLIALSAALAFGGAAIAQEKKDAPAAAPAAAAPADAAKDAVKDAAPAPAAPAAGAAPAAAMALIVHGLFELLSHWLIPRGLR